MAIWEIYVPSSVHKKVRTQVYVVRILSMNVLYVYVFVYCLLIQILVLTQNLLVLSNSGFVEDE